MTDIASLVLAVDARQTDAAAESLAKLTAAGARTEAATDKLGASQVRAATQFQAVAQSGGQARAGMQQLGYQLGDVATMFSLGAKPAQIFASQIGQVTQAVQLMGGGTSRLAAFLGGPWGIALSVGAIALTPLIAKLFEADTATKDLRESQTRLAESMTGLADSRAALDEALGRNIGQYRELRIAAINTGVAELAAAQASVQARQADLATSQRVGAQYRGDAPLTGNAVTRASTVMAGMFGMGNTTSEVVALNDATAELNAQSASLLQNTASLQRLLNGGGGGGSSGGITGSTRAYTAAVSEEVQARNAQAEATASYIASLQTELATLGLSGEALRQIEVARQIGLAGSQAEKDAIEALNIALLEANTIREREAEVINEAAIAAAKYQDQMDAIKDAGESAFQRDADAAKVLVDQMRDLIGMVGNAGGAGGVIGTLLGITSGNIGSIGGGIGDLLNIGTGSTTNDKGEVIARTLGDDLRQIFKLDGEFGKTMSGLLEGAGVGTLAATSVFGKQDMGEQIGSAIGGAAGKALGTAIGGPLGGAIGSAIGGMLGSVVGGAFTKTKYGTASLTGAGDASIAARGGGRADSASGLAGNVQTALQDVAELLGGAVGAFNVSIGTYKDSFRVSGSGKTGKLKGGDVKDFGDDASAAIAFAIADAIKDGAITGVSESVRALLGKGSDVQKQLDKAVKFQSVFDMLLEATDPVAFALKEIGDQFGDLRKIFDEASASAAEYADLEKLLSLKRTEAMDAARQSKLDEMSDTFGLQIRMLELMGKSEEALTAARILEIAGMKAALQPLQAMVYELEDARGVIEKFGPLGDSLRAFREELLGQAGGGGFAGITARFRNTAGNAATGDANALAAFQGDASAYLEAARANAGSALEYQRALSEVLTGTDKGIFAADTQVQMAQLQIDAISNQTNVIQQMRTEIREANVQIAGNSGALLRLFQRFEGEGLLVRTDADTPLATVAS